MAAQNPPIGTAPPSQGRSSSTTAAPRSSRLSHEAFEREFGAIGSGAIYVWQVPVRITHWLIVASIVVLSVTGLYIHGPFFPAPDDRERGRPDGDDAVHPRDHRHRLHVRLRRPLLLGLRRQQLLELAGDHPPQPGAALLGPRDGQVLPVPAPRPGPRHGPQLPGRRDLHDRLDRDGRPDPHRPPADGVGPRGPADHDVLRLGQHGPGRDPDRPHAPLPPHLPVRRLRDPPRLLRDPRRLRGAERDDVLDLLGLEEHQAGRGRSRRSASPGAAHRRSTTGSRSRRTSSGRRPPATADG